jgi:hypothetical protein
MRALVLPLSLLVVASPLAAQSASFVYTLGKDTVAVDQYTRTATALEGEMVQRAGAAVARTRYRITIARNGRPAAVTIARLQADGTPFPNAAIETRYTIGADSVVREIAFADSTPRRAFAARQAVVNFPTYVYGPLELLANLRRRGTAMDSVPAVAGGTAVGFTGLRPAGGDTLRLVGTVPYEMRVRFDARDRLLSVDGSFTTNKVVATRGEGGFDIAAIAAGMRPTGTLSARATARAPFGSGGMVLIDYGRPMVRERTVWGGTLVPFDSVWRAGANDATHLFTTRTLALGSLTLAPGMYTLWLQHTRNGTFLIVNRQTGQWGTQYDASHDIGRVELQMAAAPAPVEEFTITVRAINPTRGAIEFAWGDRMGSVQFGATR